MSIPNWLKEDIKELALYEVRNSLAIYELYIKYANSKTPEDIDEGLKHLNLVNRRLDYIDNNLLTIAEAIKCQQRKN